LALGAKPLDEPPIDLRSSRGRAGAADQLARHFPPQLEAVVSSLERDRSLVHHSSAGRTGIRCRRHQVAAEL
jgi:hypothetical protein